MISPLLCEDAICVVLKGSYVLLLYPTVSEKIENVPLLAMVWNVCCFLVLEVSS